MQHTRYNGVPGYANRPKIFWGNPLGNPARTHYLHTVIKNLHHDPRTFLKIIPMTNRINNRLAKRVFRQLKDILTPQCLNFVPHPQMLLQKNHGVINIANNIPVELLGIQNMHFLHAFVKCAYNPRVPKQNVLIIHPEKQGSGVGKTKLAANQPRTVKIPKNRALVQHLTNPRQPHIATISRLIKPLRNRQIFPNNLIIPKTPLALEKFNDALPLQFLRIRSRTQVKALSARVRLETPLGNRHHHDAALNLDIHFQTRLYLVDRILNPRPGGIADIGTNHPPLIVHPNKYPPAGSIGKSTRLRSK
jgi:hypothetical protein